MQSNMGGANHFKEVRAGVAEKWLASHAGTSPVDGRSSDQSKDSSRSASDDSKKASSDEGIDSYNRIAAGAIPVTPVTFRGTLQSAPQPDPKLLQQFPNPRMRSQATGQMTSPQRAKDAGHSSPSKLFSSSLANGNEKLYEAYNDLHSLAQDFQKPFDAPAILVVGHQTDGKSALVEALMGFQFNHVGGGTKTRRPITLHMKYNPECIEPRCYLITDDRRMKEEERTLEELQDHIESENHRLEQEALQFWAKEIVVRIEYKYCPNLTIIDTPGLIAAAPGKKNHQLQAQARAVEQLVLNKMKQREFIILCLEDCSDWSNATTRRVVMQMDPELTRTVVVSTKLDTRIPQFGRAADVELFLRPPSRLLDGDILGNTPFFSSVPSDRVGNDRDSVLRTNDQFREAVAMREARDVAMLEEKLDRPLHAAERARIGVSRLRLFLEQLLQRRYMESVPSIVPLLDREYRGAAVRLNATIRELSNLDGAKLKERGRIFRDQYLKKLSVILKGTVAAPTERFGEALQDERIIGGAFSGFDGNQLPQKFIPNANMRLYGGAQYHRAMHEFRTIVGSMKCPIVNREEIVNACGVEDIHDGTNYFRTACVIAVAKAKDVFEPFLHQLGSRLSHILRRVMPIAMYLLQRDGEFLTGHEVFMKRIATTFESFVEDTERSCKDKCLEDLLSTTRYVTWALHHKNRGGLRAFLDNMCSNKAASVLEPLADISNQQENVRPVRKPAAPDADESVRKEQSQARLVDLLESTLWNRRLAPSSELACDWQDIVNALVSQIFQGIRDYFVQSAELKFNCFFLMPMIDRFPGLLRERLEVAYEEDLDNVFDVGTVRAALEAQKDELDHELRRVEKLQEKFASIHHNLSSVHPIPNIQQETMNDFARLNVR
ncbi:dynamin family protein [Klebsormidium nitens]|uniref:Dynamin family protein n=1 Tax=Klebsormidium nitens TaxID=105231 RepID=A0A1Y1HPY9_KLENI|nr:dynamin family protein [Klebsormidium nitens]|eukprot:GAQ80690.1 dynamin family protein [Klebsormidium nitens]